MCDPNFGLNNLSVACEAGLQVEREFSFQALTNPYLELRCALHHVQKRNMYSAHEFHVLVHTSSFNLHAAASSHNWGRKAGGW